MTHPFNALLNEFAFAVRHLVPTIPAEVKEEAGEILERLKANASAKESEIKEAFYDIGLKEYPHRHAYQELTQGVAKDELINLVLEHVNAFVRSVIKPHLDTGVSLEALVKSDLLEKALTVEQRYQIEDGILLANRKIADKLQVTHGTEEKKYELLVETWKQQAKKIQEAIDTLASLVVEADAGQREEIQSTVARFREGFILTEPDPELEEVQKEIEYWNETLHSEE